MGAVANISTFRGDSKPPLKGWFQKRKKKVAWVKLQVFAAVMKIALIPLPIEAVLNRLQHVGLKKKRIG